MDGTPLGMGMKKFKHLQYTSRRYVMTPEESAQWERSDDHERRILIDVLGARLADDTRSAGCSISIYRNDGTLIAKSTHHEPLFPEGSIS